MNFKQLRKLAVLIIIVNIVVVCISVSSNLLPKITSDIRVLYPEESLELSSLELEEAKFQSGLYDVIVLDNLDLDQDYFEIEELRLKLLTLEGISSLLSPLEADDQGYAQGFLVVKNPSGVEDHFKHQVGRFLLEIDPTLEDKDRSQLNLSINQVIKNFPKLSINRHGAFFISESLTSAIEYETSRLIPLCIVLLFSLLIIIFRNIYYSIIALLPAFFSLVSVLFITAFFAVNLNPVSQVAPPFILAVATAYSIHIFLNLKERYVLNREVFQAILYASLTTSLGLFSLISLVVKGVTTFAIIAGLGNLLAAIYALVFIPLLVDPQKIKVALKVPEVSRKAQKLGAIFLLVLISFAVYGINLIKLDTDPVSFLPNSGSEIRQIDAVKKYFPGNRFVSLIINSKDNKNLTEQDLNALAPVANLLGNGDRVFSVVDAVKIHQQIDRHSSSQVVEGSSLLSKDKKYLRYLFETDLHGKQLLEQVASLNSSLATFFSQYASTLSYQFSSYDIVMAKQAQMITIGIVKSLLFTLLILFIVLLFLTRSLLIAMYSLIPNIIPIVLVFGLIGWIYTEISIGAALVACSALGIAVDNTFHFVVRWMKAKSLGRQAREAVAVALKDLIIPFTLTTLILTVGFAGLLFSKVLPTFQFGLLLIITLIVGLIADLTVLPYLLSKIKKN